ncbi:hypothetical protein N0V86_008198 [Didymella sp. IMI 355093]|nr:hypothetical protein N0V86_008198 [Didymella sp. IMI 355093]
MVLRIASNSLNIVARAMRNMQIPAYSPVLCGVKDVDQRGVEVETKKVMAIESAPIIICDGVDVDDGIVIVPVVDDDIAIVIDISIWLELGASEGLMESSRRRY